MTKPDASRIQEAITEWWGERCAENGPGCPICDAWAEYDALLTELREAREVAERRGRMFRRNVRLRLDAQRAVPEARAAGFEAFREMVVSHLSREKEAAKEMGFPEAAVILAGVSREISALQPQKDSSDE